MPKKIPKEAYVVFRGRKPGVYRSWSECQEQVEGFPKNKFLGYESGLEADEAWEEWTRKASYKLAANVALASSNGTRSWSESIHSPSVWVEPTAPLSRSSAPPPAKRPHVIDLTDDSDGEQRAPKRIKSQYPFGGPVVGTFEPQHLDEESAMRSPTSQNINGAAVVGAFKSQFINLEAQLESFQRPLLPVEEERIELSAEQEKVVKMSLRRHNIFLTGAAGCGKTVTLKAILQRLAKKKKKVQVIAPTGIAALPLNGKTTFSFAGVSAH